MIDLMPCPHCGKIPDYQEFNVSPKLKGRVVCACGAEIRQHRDWSKKQTIEAWNTRVEPTFKAVTRDSAWGGYTRHCGNCGADLDCDTRNSPQKYCPRCGVKLTAV